MTQSPLIISSLLWIQPPVTNYLLWKAACSRNKPPTYTPPLRKENTSLVFNDQDKADMLASYLATMFTPDEIHTDVNMEFNITMAEPIQPVTPKEVLTVINNFQLKKAPGVDLITAKMLKEAL